MPKQKRNSRQQSRSQLRKSKKTAKKQKRQEHHKAKAAMASSRRGRQGDALDADADADASNNGFDANMPSRKRRRSRSSSADISNGFMDLLGEQGLLAGEAGDKAKAASRDAERAEIEYLEKKLGINNEKSRRKLNKEFIEYDGMADGFGSFLDTLDGVMDGSGTLGDSDMDMEDESEGEGGDAIDTRVGHRDGTSDDDNDDEDENEEDGSDGGDNVDEDVDASLTYRPAQGEDIYGRSVGDKVAAVAETRYIPPHLRNKAGGSDDTARLRRLVNSQMNRLSEDSLEPVCSALLDLYDKNPKGAMNSVMMDLTFANCVNETQIMAPLCALFSAVLAALHGAEGAAVGGYFIEHLVKRFTSARDEVKSPDFQRSHVAIDCKRPGNLLLLIANLYNLGVVHCSLVYDIVRLLAGAESSSLFDEVDVELLLLLVRNCGYQLRADDHEALSEIVMLTSRRMAGSADVPPRVRFMLDSMNDVKRNKKRQSNLQEAERSARMKKWLAHFNGRATKSGFTTASRDKCLRVSLADLLTCETTGRWWVAGASWAGRGSAAAAAEAEAANAAPQTTSQQPQRKKGDSLVELAAEQRMNSDVRRSIFVAIMGSSDFEDGLERLLRLNLRGQQDREIVHVLVHCCGQERHYNPYYAHLAVHLCQHSSKLRFTFQVTFWDIFKQIDESAPRRLANLAKLLAHLIGNECLQIAMLKAVDLPSLEVYGILFFRVMFMNLFRQLSDASQLDRVFRPLAADAPDKRIVRDNVAVFLDQHIRPHARQEEDGKLIKRQLNFLKKLFK